MKWVHIEARLLDAAKMRAGLEGPAVKCAITAATTRLGNKAAYSKLEAAMFEALKAFENVGGHGSLRG